MTQPQNRRAVNAVSPHAGQFRLTLEPELDLAAAITAHTGRDLFEGVTDTAERKARARIAIIVGKLEQLACGDSTFAEVFERTYGEPLRLPHAVVPARPPTTRKGRAA